MRPPRAAGVFRGPGNNNITYLSKKEEEQEEEGKKKKNTYCVCTWLDIMFQVAMWYQVHPSVSWDL